MTGMRFRIDLAYIGFFRPVLAALALAGIVGQVNGSGAKEELRNVDHLVSVMESGNLNEVIGVINNVKKIVYNKKYLKILHSYWDKASSACDKSSEHIVCNELVRIEIADALVQGLRNSTIDIDPKPFHLYSKSMLGHEKDRVAGQASTVLAHFEREEDVRLIRKLAMDSSSRIFREAVVALAGMCNPAAEKALIDIKNNVASSSRKEFIESVNRRMENLKEESGMCRSWRRLE